MNSLNQFYSSPKNLSYLSIGGFALIVLCELLTIAFGIGQIINPLAMIDLDETGGESTWILLQSLVAVLKLPAFVFTVVVFLMWLYRANRNLTPLEADNIQYSPGWAVGWWFIPFANLVKPFQVVSEVWNKSDPEADPNFNFLSNNTGTANLLYFWWFFWIVSNIASNASSRLYDSVDHKSLEIGGYFFVATGFLTLMGAVLAMLVVRDITRRQEERFQRIGAARRQFVAPPAPPEFN